MNALVQITQGGMDGAVTRNAGHAAKGLGTELTEKWLSPEPSCPAWPAWDALSLRTSSTAGEKAACNRAINSFSMLIFFTLPPSICRSKR